MQEEAASKYEKEASQFWDAFYGTHENKFFKERHWLFTELPELSNGEHVLSKELDGDEYPGSKSAFRVLEVGCGNGSSVFPLLEANSLKENGFVYCCDFSHKAIELVKSNPSYDASRCHAFVYDVSSEGTTLPFPENSLDMILLIFVMSAISPDRYVF